MRSAKWQTTFFFTCMNFERRPSLNIDLILLMIIIVLMISVLLNRISSRTGIPALLFFILLGLLAGEDGITRIPFHDLTLAENICSTALVFIMFYGGFGMKWKQAQKTAGLSIALSAGGTVLTALFTGLFARFVLKMDWLTAFLAGSVIASTDAASVFSILRARHLDLRYHTASILEMESGSNDPFAYLLTIVLLSLMNGNGASFGSILVMVLQQVLIGSLCGLLTAFLTIFLLQKKKVDTEGFDLVFVTAAALLSYVLLRLFGGNGYLSAYLAGILIGNAQIPDKQKLVHFFDGFTSLAQILIFFLLGLLASPSHLLPNAGTALAIFLFLLLAARPAAVFLIGTFFHMPVRQGILISWAGLRGASSIVFAVTAVSGASLSVDLYHIVFLIVLISILLQGTLMPWIAKKLDMIDEKEDVMKTFNDYVSDTDLAVLRIRVSKDSGWCAKELSEISLPPSVLAVMIIRSGRSFVPDGNTRLLDQDIVLIAGLTAQDSEVLHVTRETIGSEDERVGRKLSEIRSTGLIILVRRGSSSFLPDGNTILQAGDELLLHSSVSE